MEEKEVVNLLKFYQHELMNEFQVIHGYLSMKDTDMTKDKLNDLINRFVKERQLTSLNAPGFILWILRFNQRQKNIRLTYDISNSPLDLQKIDGLMVEGCKQLVQVISILGMAEELYHIHLHIGKQNNQELLLTFSVIGQLEQENHMTNEKWKNSLLENIKYTADGLTGKLVFSTE